ncbi:MAG: type II CRISPR RNA-guided endonuclease Cas9 [Proteobacteria bacterium]|nr:type II CRISPR RNA-guided endonuclease Cas9 [Pseudomonadota bacterium]
MSNKVLGLDLGSNSLGWALLEETNGNSSRIIDLGSRIFTKAVEEKVPTPKNVKRRDRRLGRRVLQRRARRKQRMLNYLASLNLLPKELQGHTQPEVLLNKLGDPYELRTKALDSELSPHEYGRVLLHFVARRGFLSSKKQLAGDLVDDPDTVAYLNELDDKPAKDKEEGKFKTDIAEVRKNIKETSARTLGEYLYKREKDECKRNRSHDGGHLRTDRKMYQDELEQIWEKQSQYFTHLPDDFMLDKKGIKHIIFYQRPLKLKKDRVGKCSLEPKNNRASMARLEVQRYRYLLDINDLRCFERHTGQELIINAEGKQKLKIYFEHNARIELTKLKKILKLDRQTKLNLEAKNLKGNITACEIRTVLGELWDNYSDETQQSLVEDLLSIKKKSALKTRLLTHWKFDKAQAVPLCLLEFEPSHSNHSLKAINKLLPYLEQGLHYDEARVKAGYDRVKAGYDYVVKEITVQEKLAAPPVTSNPIVNRGLHELKRVINAIIKQYGKPDAIRIEMARDLEMNTERYNDSKKQQTENNEKNKEAVKAYQEEAKLHPHLGLSKYPSRDDKIKYRLWLEQGYKCIYSGTHIQRSQLFSDEVEVDHIVPRSLCLDDSYINKVVCLMADNRYKGQRTPIDAWGGDNDKWHEITKRVDSIYKDRPFVKYRKKTTHPKKEQFYMRYEGISKKYGMSSAQLNDTRYIAKLALEYVEQLDCDVTTSKGATTSWLRKQWGLNNLISKINIKERADHREHAIDAAVIACVDRSFYKKVISSIEQSEKMYKKIYLELPYSNFRDEVDENLKHLIVSHASQRKLSGGLHEETGAGFIEKHGRLVYRKNLARDFTEKKAKNIVKDIVDETIKELVQAHLAKHDNDPKKAFADGVTVYHKDGKTPIKRVRVWQSPTSQFTSQSKLENSKFGVKDKSGKVFKWMSYGNMHHVEIIQHRETKKYKGEFVTMMEASHRAKGIKSTLNPDGDKQTIVKQEHGNEWQFIMALHINDLVSVAAENGEREFYRVQNFMKKQGYLVLRLNTSSTINNENEEIQSSVHNLFTKLNFRAYTINVIGILSNDQKDH